VERETSPLGKRPKVHFKNPCEAPPTSKARAVTSGQGREVMPGRRWKSWRSSKNDERSSPAHSGSCKQAGHHGDEQVVGKDGCFVMERGEGGEVVVEGGHRRKPLRSSENDERYISVHQNQSEVSERCESDISRSTRHQASSLSYIQSSPSLIVQTAPGLCPKGSEQHPSDVVTYKRSSRNVTQLGEGKDRPAPSHPVLSFPALEGQCENDEKRRLASFKQSGHRRDSQSVENDDRLITGRGKRRGKDSGQYRHVEMSGNERLTVRDVSCHQYQTRKNLFCGHQPSTPSTPSLPVDGEHQCPLEGRKLCRVDTGTSEAGQPMPYREVRQEKCQKGLEMLAAPRERF